MNSFWHRLPKPFFVQAPMEDVTDAAFRRLIARIGKPHVTYTEFTSADGLVLADEKGRAALEVKLMFDEVERPIVAQLFSAVPERMELAARLVAERGFDGIDINMGCPVQNVVQSGCGADLIQHPDRARALMRAAKEGSGLPVSVKTRIGFNKDDVDTWVPELLAEKPAALTFHLRTRKEMSDVPAHWEAVPRIVALRDKLSPETVILGNGDVKDLADARRKVDETGCDGVMLGRAIYGNPWLYAGRTQPPAPRERIEALAEHVRLFDELLGRVTHFAVMKKHFKAYISGWDGAKELRMRLMEAQSADEALNVLKRSV